LFLRVLLVLRFGTSFLVIGKNNGFTYVTVLRNYATNYMQQGEFSKAEPLLLEAQEIMLKMRAENMLGQTSRETMEYARILDNLGLAHRLKHQYGKAEQFHLEAQEIMHKENKNKDFSLAISVDNLGVLYVETEQFSKAEATIQEAQEIMRKMRAEDTLQYAATLFNLAEMHKKIAIMSMLHISF
jgi:tetratricopeptide (TPR) repeat protein